MRSLWVRVLLAGAALLTGHATVRADAIPAAKIEAVEQLLVKKMSAEGIPGLSIAIVLDGVPAWSRGYGMADVENSVPATERTAYRTASIGKTLTATAVLRLMEKGKIDLDVPIQRYCPTFPEKRWPITTRHLLTHTSGIRHYGGPHEEEELFNTRHYDSVVAALTIFQDDPLLFEPGTRQEYSTFGYDVLGCVVEGATGERFLDVMRELVFEPAGMKNTRDDAPRAIVPHRAAGYVRTDAGELRNARAVDMSSKMPAGGYITTVVDLARFAAALMEHRLIGPETFAAMRTPTKLADGQVVNYGMGLAVSAPDDLWYGEREALHGGGTPKVSGILYMLPERRFAVVVMMNLEERPERVKLTAEIARHVLDLDASGAPGPP